jgi:hypothetical protein
VQLAPVLSETATEPLGVPPKAPVTLTETSTDCPMTEGLGEAEMARLVLALFTVWLTVPELPLKFPSPP